MDGFHIESWGNQPQAGASLLSLRTCSLAGPVAGTVNSAGITRPRRQGASVGPMAAVRGLNPRVCSEGVVLDGAVWTCLTAPQTQETLEELEAS